MVLQWYNPRYNHNVISYNLTMICSTWNVAIYDSLSTGFQVKYYFPYYFLMTACHKIATYTLYHIADKVTSPTLCQTILQETHSPNYTPETRILKTLSHRESRILYTKFMENHGPRKSSQRVTTLTDLYHYLSNGESFHLLLCII